MHPLNKKPFAAAFLLILFAVVLAGPSLAQASTRSAGQSAAPPASAAAHEALMKQAKSWVKALSEQEAFQGWKNAKLQIQALGPGTHGWLITLHDSKKQPIGYLVAYAGDKQTYQLGEYGLGSQPLFDEATLKRSLLDNGLIGSMTDSSYRIVKHYAHPFAAVWEVTIDKMTYWLDAKSGELLPLDQTAWNLLEQDSSAMRGSSRTFNNQASGDAKRMILNASFDPYERLPWLLKEQPFDASDESSFSERLASKQQLRYVSEPFGDKMLYALPVVGYLQWSGGRIDAALDMNGTRFIPLTQLVQLGSFYK